MKTVIREPLVHFLLIGGALFLLSIWRGDAAPGLPGPGGPGATRILVSREAIDLMNGQFEKTWQRPPNEEERQKLIEDFVRNEIYYREAIAASLDRDDEVIKRRLRQRMEFIYEDIGSLGEPAEDDLAAYLERHREKYLADPQLSFRQVYLDVSRRGKSTESDVRLILAQLAGGQDPGSLGDPTQLAAEVPLSPLWEIRKQFGDEFAKGLLDLEPGAWRGPIRSGFGLHLVLVRDRVAGQLPELAAIREAVKRDFMAERQGALKDAAYRKIRERYTVTVEGPAAPVSPAAAPGKEGVGR